MKEEKIQKIGVVFSVEFRNRELETDDFDPRKICPEFEKQWTNYTYHEGKRWDSFFIKGILTVEQLHIWLERMPMTMSKHAHVDRQNDRWIVFEAENSESVLEMLCWPFLESGNYKPSVKRKAMMKEFGS